MSARLKEAIKSIVLVVLFLTTILFLYLLWGEPHGGGGLISSFSGADGAFGKAPALSDFIRPSYVALSEGSGSYRKSSGGEKEILSSAINFFKELSKGTPPAVEEISAEQYRHAMADFKSIQIIGCCDIPFADFVRFHDIRSSSAFDNIGYISAFAFSNAAKDSVFVCDYAADKYYRVLSDRKFDFTDRIAEKTSPKQEICYTMGNIFGGDGCAVVPLSPKKDLSEEPYMTEAKSLGEAHKKDLAEKIFGENLDFVRRITDGFGNVTYMYGYGRKVFTAAADGSFVYRAELAGGGRGDFYKDLEIAVKTAAAFGSFEGGKEEYSLAYSREEGDSRSGSRSFGFARRLNGYEILGEEGGAAEITVSGGKVVYYRRNAVVLGKEREEGPERKAADPANVVAGSCHHIYNVLKGNVLAAASDEALSYAVGEVTDVSAAYFLSNQNDTLIPCWLVKTREGPTFFFDLYEGFPLGLRR